MLSLSKLFFFLSFSCLVLNEGCYKQMVFGDETIFEKQSPVATVSSMIQPNEFGRTVRMKGKVTAMCPDADRCWLVLTDNANIIRVEYTKPNVQPTWDIIQFNSIVEGTVQEKIIDITSKGYDDYEKSCNSPITKNLKSAKVPVFVAYRIEILPK